MRKPFFLILLVVGAILLIYGLSASDSVASNVSETVRGTPTDRTIVLIVLGSVGLLAGSIGLLVRRRG
jgi:uncharacterized membrane protein